MPDTLTVPADAPLGEVSRDVTDPAANTPAGADLIALLRGVRPTRRAVTIYTRPDLLADLDVLAERSRIAGRAEQDTTTMRAQRNKLIQEIAASSVDVVVEARSHERLNQVMEAAGDDDEARNVAIVHDMIVHPEGMALEDVAALAQAQPAQFALLLNAATEAVTKAPQVTGPFSPVSSPARSMRP